MRARILTTAGVVHLTIAALLSLTFLTGLPDPVAGSELGFTPTSTPLPTDTPTPTATPTSTPVVTPTSPPSPPKPHLTITKTASPAQVLPGGQVTFGIQVCNVGDATADNVIVSDALPPELEMVSASASQGAVVVEGNGMRAELGSVYPGYCAEVTIVALVRADVAPGTQIRNVASVGDTYDDVTVPVVGFLPESGRIAPLAVAVGLLVVGVSLLIGGLAVRARNRVC
ncbi:MAG: DUF11 domain-containing protein [Anaerolineae bacterium]